MKEENEINDIRKLILGLAMTPEELKQKEIEISKDELSKLESQFKEKYK